MLLDRRPPELRRRSYLVVVAALIAIVLFCTNVGQLGKHTVAVVFYCLVALTLVFLFVLPFVRLLCARPRQPRLAFQVGATSILTYAYVVIALVKPLPGATIVLLLGNAIIDRLLDRIPQVSFQEIAQNIAAVRKGQRAEKMDRSF